MVVAKAHMLSTRDGSSIAIVVYILEVITELSCICLTL
jgi:hypothetical protein